MTAGHVKWEESLLPVCPDPKDLGILQLSPLYFVAFSYTWIPGQGAFWGGQWRLLALTEPPSKHRDIVLVQSFRKPGVPQTTISAAYYVGGLYSGVLCSLSRLALGTTVYKQDLAGVFIFRKWPPNALCDNERNNLLWHISSLYSKCHI